MWLGLDDTDSLDGGCTTLVFHKLLEALPCEYGEPRLTRLWPFAKRRTRGNASLSVQIYADKSIIEWLDNYWENNIQCLKGNIAESEHSDRTQYPSDPGMVLFFEQPDADYYWSAVRGEVDFYEGGYQWGGNGRIGAAASCSWRADNVTWEGIAWRDGIRHVNEDALAIVDDMEGTFLCRDPRTKRGLISPRGPCPVMFGVRARSKQVAEQATKLLVEESAPTIGSRVYATNQASGDHLEETFAFTVHDKSILQGGHVILNEEFLAFAESGDLNKLAQWIGIGDEIECLGLRYEGKIHLEAIKVINSTTKQRPMCDCGVRMKSMGVNQGVRCPKCKIKSEVLWVETKRKPIFSGWVQPPVDKRRHLAKTLD